ncbi:MAG: dipeptide ABC transporter ATP-binding protein [Ktedonobacteraceae bacterium]
MDVPIMDTKAVERADFVSVRGLKTFFPLRQRGSGLTQLWQGKMLLKAVDGVDFSIARGKTLGLVGESGSGKSTVARSLLQLVKPTSGEVLFDGLDLCKCKPGELRALRQRMQFIFQDPYASLDPRQTVGFTVGEPLMIHRRVTAKQLREQVASLLSMVGLSADAANRYPHEFSGGQRQRIGIARALATSPDFVVADEPISSLDISIQAQILNLLRQLQDQLHLTYLFISHDLSAVQYLSDEVAVMYLGKIVEIAPTTLLFEQPRHPYTRLLLQSVPVARWEKQELPGQVTEGETPSLLKTSQGCAFAMRCSHVIERCRKEVPRLAPIVAGSPQKAACFLAAALE